MYNSKFPPHSKNTVNFKYKICHKIQYLHQLIIQHIRHNAQVVINISRIIINIIIYKVICNRTTPPPKKKL